MSADFHCWDPVLKLQPSDPDFPQKVDALYETEEPPSPVLLGFTAALLERYQDLTATDNTAWSVGPLSGEIIGRFMNVPVRWSRYEEAGPFVIETAQRFGLCCYDLAANRFYMPGRLNRPTA